VGIAARFVKKTIPDRENITILIKVPDRHQDLTFVVVLFLFLLLLLLLFLTFVDSRLLLLLVEELVLKGELLYAGEPIQVPPEGESRPHFVGVDLFDNEDNSPDEECCSCDDII
jgi:hypothetical protein